MILRVASVDWAKEGASPEAVAEAFGAAALTVAVLEALFDDPELREKALAAMKATPHEPAAEER